MKTIHRLLPVFLSLLVLFEVIAYTTTITPPSEKYIQLYVLSSNGTANDYFPNNSPYVTVGEQMSWEFAVVNDMGFVQLVAILVKLGNQSTVEPNDTLVSPAAAPLVTEFEQFVQANETWSIPFEWQVTNFTSAPDGRLHMISLDIDNMTYVVQNPPSCSLTSCSLRLIFELWTWNTDSANFQIGWWNGEQRRIAWLQLWFDLALNGGSK